MKHHISPLKMSIVSHKDDGAIVASLVMDGMPEIVVSTFSSQLAEINKGAYNLWQDAMQAIIVKLNEDVLGATVVRTEKMPHCEDN